MRFVPTKSEQQQSGLMLHRSRQLLVRQRTMLSNAIRGHLAEVEPLLRATCTHEIDATQPIERVVAELMAIGARE